MAILLGVTIVLGTTRVVSVVLSVLLLLVCNVCTLHTSNNNTDNTELRVAPIMASAVHVPHRPSVAWCCQEWA